MDPQVSATVRHTIPTFPTIHQDTLINNSATLKSNIRAYPQRGFKIKNNRIAPVPMKSDKL